jgi:Domain of unknown function (DUF3786)
MVTRLSGWRLQSDEIERLKRLVSSGLVCLEFLGYEVNLDSGEVYDKLKEELCNEKDIVVSFILLAHYSMAEPVERTGILVNFRDLPGGHAYEKAFTQRVIEPVAKTFGDKPEALIEAAKLLNGVALTYGDSSVEIPVLTRIPIVFIIWKADEFPASATVLFEEPASHYLPTEDLAVLAELTTMRLEQSWATLRKT